jgi:hypothetical protein
MAITYVDGSPGLVATQTFSTTITLTIPATVQAGDILLLDVSTGDNNGMTATDNDTGGNAWTVKLNTANGNTRSLTTLWKRATSGTAGKTVTVSGGTTNACGGITVYRGCIATGDPIEVLTGEVNALANNNHASITTLTAGAMVIIAATIADDRRYTANSVACTNPANLTERFDIINATGASDGSIFHADGERTTAGATGTFSWTWAADAVGASHAYALTPATSGPTTVEADGDSDGLATPTGVSGATKGAEGASTGLATPTGAGAARATADAASAGIATPAATSVTVLPGIGASEGVAAPASVSAPLFAGVTASTGVATPAATSATIIAGVGASVGEGVGLGEGEAVGGGATIVEADGASSGVGTAAASASALTAGVSTAAGVGSPQALASAFALTSGASAGVAAPTALASALWAVLASSIGVGAGLGEGEDGAGGTIVEADGVSIGAGAAAALGAYVLAARGISEVGGSGGFALIIND